MEKLTDKVKNEVINYGGMPVARGTVYQIVLEDKGDKKAADYVAFGASYPVLPPGTAGMTMAEFRFTEKHTILPEGWLYDSGLGLPQPSPKVRITASGPFKGKTGTIVNESWAGKGMSCLVELDERTGGPLDRPQFVRIAKSQTVPVVRPGAKKAAVARPRLTR